MTEDPATQRQKRMQGHIDGLRLDGVHEEILDAITLFEDEMILSSPHKAAGVLEAVKAFREACLRHGIV